MANSDEKYNIEIHNIEKYNLVSNWETYLHMMLYNTDYDMHSKALFVLLHLEYIEKQDVEQYNKIMDTYCYLIKDLCELVGTE
jgi:hypothetical protein